jgi:hypothetical protein
MERNGTTEISCLGKSRSEEIDVLIADVVHSGHSLGGFIAEAFNYDYPGCQTATFATGGTFCSNSLEIIRVSNDTSLAPLVGAGSKFPRAYRVPNPPPSKSKLPVRFLRRFDPVSKGLKVNNLMVLL